MIGRLLWGVMGLAALAIGGYAILMLSLPGLRAEFLAGMMRDTPLATWAHLGFGAVALFTGVLQFSARLRRKHLSLHRWTGRLYVISCLSSGLAGGYMALTTPGGLAAQFGFSALALCWLITTTVAWRCIRTGDVIHHRVWMTRSYALTLAAVSLRIYLPLALGNGIAFEDAYPAVAWLCWVPNLLIAEWLVIPLTVTSRRASSAPLCERSPDSCEPAWPRWACAAQCPCSPRKRK